MFVAKVYVIVEAAFAQSSNSLAREKFNERLWGPAL